MKYFSLIIAMVSLWSTSAFAYVNCDDVPVKVESSQAPGFHNFNELGLTGSLLFVSVPVANCTNSTGDPLTGAVFMVMDGIDASDDRKKLWSSMLLTAHASGKTIKFHATDKGVTSNGYRALVPYYLVLNQ